MERPVPGARYPIDGATHCTVTVAHDGAPTLRCATIVKSSGGAPSTRFTEGHSQWTMPLDAGQGATVSIVLYDCDDEPGRTVGDRGAVTVTVGELSFEVPARKERHSAVVLAQIYPHGEGRRLRVLGDGYAFGIRAMARKEGFDAQQLLPTPRRDRTPDHIPDPSAGGRPPRTGRTSGSGVIVAPDHVVTNQHVVEGVEHCTVHGPDGDVRARVVARDPSNDLALLRAPGVGGVPLPIRPASMAHLGEAVTAAGYPLREILGTDLKVTHGNLSSLRGGDGNVCAVQFTAPISSGSSGGAIVDRNGNLVGIVAASLAHGRMHDMGAISEGTNFGVKASLVLELLVAMGVEGADAPCRSNVAPHDLARTLRRGVVSIIS